MSFGGAVAGSGVLARNVTVGDGKDYIGQSVSEAYGVLKDSMRALSTKWAESAITVLPGFQKLIPPGYENEFWNGFVWSHMFDIPYDSSRYSAIRNRAKVNIERALVAYKMQYEDWTDHAKSWFYSKKPLGILPPGPSQVAVIMAGGYDAVKEQVEYAYSAKFPFLPDIGKTLGSVSPKS